MRKELRRQHSVEKVLLCRFCNRGREKWLKVNFGTKQLQVLTRKFWDLKSTSPEYFEAWNQLHQKVLGLDINFTRKFLGSKLTSQESCQAWNPLYQKVLGLEIHFTKKFWGLKPIWPESFGAWHQSGLNSGVCELVPVWWGSDGRVFQGGKPASSLIDFSWIFFYIVTFTFR